MIAKVTDANGLVADDNGKGLYDIYDEYLITNLLHFESKNSSFFIHVFTFMNLAIYNLLSIFFFLK